MRILTGKYKGRIILRPKHVRPTQDKVRKAIFDILGDVSGLNFLELFAASGAVGFEALSRGAKSLTLVENDTFCLRVIRQNMERLGVKVCQVLPRSFEQAIVFLSQRQKKFEVIFLDPPYHTDLTKKTLQMLAAYDIVAPCGLVVAQHSKSQTLPQSVGELSLLRRYAYGDTVLSLFQKGDLSNVSESDLPRKL